MTTPSSTVPATGDPSRPLDDSKKRGRTFYGRTAKVGAVWSMMRQGGNELIGLPVSMIMARLLSPQDFGIAAASTFFVRLATRLSQLGLSASLLRVKDLRPEHASSVYVVSQSMGLITFAALYSASPFVGQFFRSREAGDLLSLAALVFVISPIGTVPAALMSRRMQFRYSALADWTDTIVGAVVTVFFALRGFAFWSIVYGNLVAVSARVLLQLYLSGWRPSFWFSPQALRDLLSIGLALQTKRLLEYASSNVDNLVVGRVLGMAGLGLYDKAFTSMNKIVVRLTLGQAAFRIFSIIHEDGERFRRAYSRLILSITVLGYPVLTGCVVVAEPLFRILYGDQWLSAVLPFRVLCIGGALQLLNAYAAQANEAAGNVWRQARRQAIGTALVVVGAAVGGACWGVTGAACGVLAATVVLGVAMQALVREATGLSWRGMLAPQAPGATCAVLLAGVLLATSAVLRVLVEEPQAWQMLMAQATTGGVFYASFLLLGPFPAVRNVVFETLDDLAPAGAVRTLNRLRGLAPR